MSEIKAVIWDMGGVILRSEDKSSRKVLAEKYKLTPEELYNLVFNSESAVRATVGEIDEDEHWKQTGKKLGISGQELNDFQYQFWRGDLVDFELIEFIRSLKGKYITALLSNAWSGARRALTIDRACMDAFQYSIFSCEVGLAKPDEAIYHKILKMVNVKPQQAIFVDDNLDNIVAANKMGIHGVQFFNSKQARDEVNSLLNEA